MTTSNTWTVHRTGDSPSPALNDVIPLHLDDVSIRGENLACKFTVTGTADATFDEATQRLTIDETAATADHLTISNITGCGGQYLNGGRFKLKASLNITSPDGPINFIS